MRPRWAQLLAMCCLRNAQPFQFMHSVGSATGAWCSIGQRTAYFNSCAPRWAQPLPKHKPIEATLFQFMHPVWDATARFRYYIAIYTIFCIYILFFIQSYLIITSIPLYLILGNVRKKVFRYSSGLFNMIFHIVFISLQIRTFCFARVIAV